MHKVFKVGGKLTKPEPVECEKIGYPNRDVNGDQMFDNSHYQSEADAWEYIRQGSNASIEWLANQINGARKNLRELEADAADAVIRSAAINEGFEKFREGKS